MKKGSRNPIAFTPIPVTVITSVVYAALITVLLVIQLVVPSAPKSATPVVGVNLTEAWRDLQTLSSGFHPYNSRQNDQVRNWLLIRIEAILKRNNVEDDQEETPAVVFSDVISNVTFSTEGRKGNSDSNREAGLSVYFEGTNIIVYIRGSDDESGDWWNTNKRSRGKGGVLVNAHYDSVSTGFGATDDGVGVVCILQLLSHFTSKGKQPKRGIVALLNNGEEDYLNGARAFTQHPLSQFAHTFLNLEGAGAGGRAILLRGTDTEIVHFYQRSKYPFASILSGDAFKRGIIRSETDYVVFSGVLGLRGLDVAFMEPRSRYHTEQDDTRHTSVDSLWHMLSAALSTMQGLTSDTTSVFDSESSDLGKVPSGHGSNAVYFDFFGSVLAVFRLQTLFALSVALLTAAPIILIIIGFILYKIDRLYLFSSSKHHHSSEGDDLVSLQGWKGVFRAPVILIIASAGVVGLAFLLKKVNPCIIYSSPYAVWSMMTSAWIFLTWFLSKVADFVRPSAFHRAYALLWMFVAGWAILIAVTVLERGPKIASGYFIVFYVAAIFLAVVISFCELFRLPRKTEYVEEIEASHISTAESLHSEGGSSERTALAPSVEEQTEEPANHNDGDDEGNATESTSLLRRERQATFAHYTTPHSDAHDPGQATLDDTKERRVYGDEQPWSWALPTWTWLLQFFVIAPIVIILVGQVGLLFVSGVYQTLADGNSVLTVYVGIAIFSVLILAPLGPFLHRYTYHIPTFLLLVFIGTLIYNLVAFPFSTNNRLKLYFLQRVDLDTGINEVLLTGVGGGYLNETILSLPSAAGQQLKCSKSSLRSDLTQCIWNGIPPRVVKNLHPGVPPVFGYADWLFFNVTREPGSNAARFHLWGQNTRACKIQFNSPISDFKVDGAGKDERFLRVSKDGSKEIRLWSRTWEKPWSVKVKWEVDENDDERGNGLDGRVICLWSDENETGVIPALDELRHYAPPWVAISKTADGLVEGSKAFLV